MTPFLIVAAAVVAVALARRDATAPRVDAAPAPAPAPSGGASMRDDRAGPTGGGFAEVAGTVVRSPTTSTGASASAGIDTTPRLAGRASHLSLVVDPARPGPPLPNLVPPELALPAGIAT